ncbi:hypothetical protein BASA50_005931 [Batrachochytrium salamandrivorans]|uniref:DNA ligase n=1 Tax=Batrachochytrium salamandrivorans TaxID=1357716 RepID=A0ABQ8FEJ7_9FUNG|nr:hypothetical protein BASA50_005931 [Batrachochytrium salamandrivorans]
MSDIKKQATLGRFFGASTTVAKQPLSLQASSSHSKKGSTIQPNPSSNPSLRPSGDCKPHGSPTHTAEESDPPSHDPQSPRPLRKQSKRRIIQSDSESSPEQDDPMPSTPKKTKGNKHAKNRLDKPSCTVSNRNSQSPIHSSPIKKVGLSSPVDAAGVKKSNDSLEGSLSDKNSKVQSPFTLSKRPHLFSKNPASPKTQEDSVDPMTEPSNSIKFSKGSNLTNSSLDKSCKKAKDTLSQSKTLPIAEVSSVKQPDTESKLVEGNSVLYSVLCEVFADIEGTTKRLEIQSYLAKFFHKVIKASPDSLTKCVYLCINRICPEYKGKELGIGESLLLKSLANAAGRDVKTIKAEVDLVGDLGTVAQTKGSQKTLFTPKPLTVGSVFQSLVEICNISGQHSQQRKISIIQKMLVSCKGSEAKYLIRSLEGKLRIGLAEQTVLSSLAHAAVLSDPATAKLSTEKKTLALAEAVVVVKSVYSAIPSYDDIIPALLSYGVMDLPKHCQMTPGIPMKPMLAHPTKSLVEVLDRFEGMSFTCEYKYDGERAQIHRLEDGRVIIYSRNSENLSGKYPEVLERIPKASKEEIKSFVLDCEAVAWDVKKGCILPFQVLSTRKRKDVKSDDVQVQVCIFAFDLLYLNGQSLITETLQRRRELLHNYFTEVDGQFQFAKHMTSDNVDEIQTFLDDSIVGNCEGLMVKTLEKEASYEPSKRSRNWLKVKKDYVNGLGDSLDLVVIGGFIGRGKRTGWYGGYLLACYDEDRESYQTICKIGTGFSEEALAEQAEFFKSHIIDKPKPYYRFGEGPNVRPDVWFEPVQVWEVKAADLSISPVHQAAFGQVDPNKGISLRFPRFIRVRDDKSPEQATSASQVAEMYTSQNINTGKALINEEGADDDFEY